MVKPPETIGPDTAFRCPKCGTVEWAIIEHRMKQERGWTELEVSLWLVSEGFTQCEAAAVVGVSERTIRRWWHAIRRSPGYLGKILAGKGAKREAINTKGHPYE
jgi:hypothetical protein